jgi:hypothetical protein
MKISLAAIIVVLGLSVAFIPKYIFPICESGDLGLFSSYQPVMRCFWFGRMELFLGVLVVFSGLILFCRPTSDSYFTMGVLLIGLGLVIILVSFNTVIGSTCGHMHSICQIGTKPAERIAGSLIAIFGLIMMLLPSKKFEQK